MTTESLREAADRFFASMPFQVADPPRYPEGINSVTLTMAQADALRRLREAIYGEAPSPTADEVE